MLSLARVAFAQAGNEFAYRYESAASIHALSDEQAAQSGSVFLKGVVTQSVDQGLAIQDASGGVWVYVDHPELYSPGDVVEVYGTVVPGFFAPAAKATSIRKRGRGPLPTPRPVNYHELSTGDLDCQYVTVSGVVRSVDLRGRTPIVHSAWLKIALDDGTIDATLPVEYAPLAKELIDARIRIDAAAVTFMNLDKQIIAPMLSLAGMENIKLLVPPPANLFATPVTPIGRLMQYRSGTDYVHGIHVAGVVTYYKPGESLVLEDAARALLVKTMQVSPINIGDHVEAVGFPAPKDSGPILEDSVFRRTNAGSSLRPTPINIADLSSGTRNYTLVSAEGTLLRNVIEPSGPALLLQNGANIFFAELYTPSADANVLRELREGSKLRVSGIGMRETEGSWNYGGENARSDRYKIVLRSPSDIQLIAPPAWWTTRPAIFTAIALLVVLLFLFFTHLIYSRSERWRLRSVLDERERLANEIHDTLAQSFAGIGYQLQAIRRALPEGSSQLRQQLDIARQLARRSHKEARLSIEPLCAESYGQVDLLSLLESSARKMVPDDSIQMTVNGTYDSNVLTTKITDTLLRICLEAIANAVRHADPKNISISLQKVDDLIRLSIEDDGVGFVKGGNLLGFGLPAMRRRAVAISAKLEITSQLGRGTCVAVTVPVAERRRGFGFIHRILQKVREQLSYGRTK
jgi:signal transduction histidine kinase